MTHEVYHEAIADIASSMDFFRDTKMNSRR